MLCPRCKIEMAVERRETEDGEERLVLYCRNPRCERYRERKAREEQNEGRT